MRSSAAILPLLLLATLDMAPTRGWAPRSPVVGSPPPGCRCSTPNPNPRGRCRTCHEEVPRG